jgi:ribosome production factor 2
MPKGREARAARALRAREPQFVETDRNLLGLRGPTSSSTGVAVLRDLLALKKPNARLLDRKNDIRPFDDVSSLEFLCTRNDCAAFAYASSSKKRPHNLVLGRTFDGHVLDMVEFGVEDFAPISAFRGPKARLGAKPAFVFTGDAWAREPVLARLQSLVLDVWGARDVTKLALAALDHVIVLTAVDAGAGAGAAAAPAALAAGAAAYAGVVHWRTYHVGLERTGGATPKSTLTAMGPSIDLKMRRAQLASADLFRTACRQPAGCVWAACAVPRPLRAPRLTPHPFLPPRAPPHPASTQSGQRTCRRTSWA